MLYACILDDHTVPERYRNYDIELNQTVRSRNHQNSLDSRSVHLKRYPLYTYINLPRNLLEQQLTAVDFLIRIPMFPSSFWIFIVVYHIFRGDRERYRLVWFCRQLLISMCSGSLFLAPMIQREVVVRDRMDEFWGWRDR